VLTLDFDRLGVHAGDLVLDVGCGTGRHAFEALRRGAHVVALDRGPADLAHAAAMLKAMLASDPALGSAGWLAVRGDACDLPFSDSTFDRVVISEVLEHIADDAAAIAEVFRVLRPGGTAAVSVPRWLPERICWMLSDSYHANDGGHVRIYRGDELRGRLEAGGFEVTGTGYAHALHAPYWWLRCLAGERAPVRAYHRVLVWDIERRPAVTRWTERALNPILGKSLVLYLRRPPSHLPALAA
jgi:SAM-dependent methyltransferase